MKRIGIFLLVGCLALCLGAKWVWAEEAELECPVDGEAIEGNESEGAETEAEAVSKIPPVKIETKVGTQSVFSGEIPITVYVTPGIDCRKSQLIWSIPRGLQAGGGEQLWFEAVKDSGRAFEIMVKPLVAGRHKVNVQVILWLYDTNYIESTSLFVEIDSNLVAVPPSAEYQRNLLFLRIAQVAGVVAVFVVIILLFKIYFKRIQSWLKVMSQRRKSLLSSKKNHSPENPEEM